MSRESKKIENLSEEYEEFCEDGYSSEFKIETDIPIPTSLNGYSSKYPWEKLEIGHSFFVKDKKPPALSTTRRYAEKKFHTKYASKLVTENGVQGTRIWRIK